IVEHHLQGFKVPVNITDQCSTHCLATSDRKAHRNFGQSDSFFRQDLDRPADEFYPKNVLR
ncbi:MAG: hypothetical protein ACLQIB_37045, partial [Isosphaeraceae bacterium]